MAERPGFPFQEYVGTIGAHLRDRTDSERMAALGQAVRQELATVGAFELVITDIGDRRVLVDGTEASVRRDGGHVFPLAPGFHVLHVADGTGPGFVFEQAFTVNGPRSVTISADRMLKRDLPPPGPAPAPAGTLIEWRDGWWHMGDPAKAADPAALFELTVSTGDDGYVFIDGGRAGWDPDKRAFCLRLGCHDLRSSRGATSFFVVGPGKGAMALSDMLATPQTVRLPPRAEEPARANHGELRLGTRAGADTYTLNVRAEASAEVTVDGSHGWEDKQDVWRWILLPGTHTIEARTGDKVPVVARRTFRVDGAGSGTFDLGELLPSVAPSETRPRPSTAPATGRGPLCALVITDLGGAEVTVDGSRGIERADGARGFTLHAGRHTLRVERGAGQGATEHPFHVSGPGGTTYSLAGLMHTPEAAQPRVLQREHLEAMRRIWPAEPAVTFKRPRGTATIHGSALPRVSVRGGGAVSAGEAAAIELLPALLDTAIKLHDILSTQIDEIVSLRDKLANADRAVAGSDVPPGDAEMDALAASGGLWYCVLPGNSSLLVRSRADRDGVLDFARNRDITPRWWAVGNDGPCEPAAKGENAPSPTASDAPAVTPAAAPVADAGAASHADAVVRLLSEGRNGYTPREIIAHCDGGGLWLISGKGWTVLAEKSEAIDRLRRGKAGDAATRWIPVHEGRVLLAPLHEPEDDTGVAPRLTPPSDAEACYQDELGRRWRVCTARFWAGQWLWQTRTLGFHDALTLRSMLRETKAWSLWWSVHHDDSDAPWPDPFGAAKVKGGSAP